MKVGSDRKFQIKEFKLPPGSRLEPLQIFEG